MPPKKDSKPPSSRISKRLSVAPKPATPVKKTIKTKPASKVGKEAPSDADMSESPKKTETNGTATVTTSNGTAGLKRKRASSVSKAPAPRRSVGRPSVGGAAKKVKVVVNEIPQPPLSNGPARTVFIFGTGDMGALGLGTEELGEITRPRLHTWFEAGIKEGKFGGVGKGIEEAVAGGMHTLVIDAEGKVWSWGVNDNASLGRVTAGVEDPENPGEIIDTEVLETEPMTVTKLVEAKFRAVKAAAGDSVSVVVGQEGDVRAWGSFRSGEGLLGFDGVPGSSKIQFDPIPLPAISNLRFSSVACGTDHVLALTIDGLVYVWGNGQQNQLGRRIIERRKINGLSPERLALRDIVHIGAGSYHSFAVNKHGQVYAWGLNSLRQTGVSENRGGAEEIIQTPTLVDALDPELHGGSKVVSISGGEHHTIFLFDNGEVWGCGRTDGSQLGLGPEHPAAKELEERKKEQLEQIMEERKAKAAAAVDEGDEYALLAAPPAVDEYIPEPVQLFFPPPPTESDPAPAFSPYPSSAEEYSAHPMIAISAGTQHNLAVSRDGNVYAWGYGNQCQLGLGPDVETAPVPARVRSKVLNDFKVIDATAGGLHCVLVAVRKE